MQLIIEIILFKVKHFEYVHIWNFFFAIACQWLQVLSVNFLVLYICLVCMCLHICICFDLLSPYMYLLSYIYVFAQHSISGF